MLLNRTQKAVLDPQKSDPPPPTTHLQKTQKGRICQSTWGRSNWQNKHSRKLCRTNNLISSISKKRRESKAKRQGAHREIWKHHLGPLAKLTFQMTPALTVITSQDPKWEWPNQHSQPMQHTINSKLLRYCKRQQERYILNILIEKKVSHGASTRFKWNDLLPFYPTKQYFYTAKHVVVSRAGL